MKNGERAFMILGIVSLLLISLLGCDNPANPSPGTISVYLSGADEYAGGSFTVEVYAEGERPVSTGPSMAPLLGLDEDTVTGEGNAAVTAKGEDENPVEFPAGNYDISVYLGENDRQYLDTINVDGNTTISITPTDMEEYPVVAF